ncbi:hypothetical protein JJJA_0058 [Achromobacter phage JWDelta]|uniref:AAA domain-containing protein n=1 Tax=Achromobacter phage JWDelta TaxID=1416008 RepID=V9SHQ1_9CAUD|nr:hypothetical protein JJJA_0058 [Achromobacter phage JWDelta]
MSEQDVPVLTDVNDQLLLIVGYSSTGKSASLRNIRDQEHWLYLNTESGKKLPFRNKFSSHTITDPYQVLDAFKAAYTNPVEEIGFKPKGIIVDSLTFLMDMYESRYVINAANTMTAWGAFSQFFKELMQLHVPSFDGPVIFTAHVKDELDEKAMELKTSVPIKGSLKNNGIEAYFSSIVACKRVLLKELEKMTNGMLDITEEEKELGFKHVFQTRLTAKTTGERIRAPMGMFTRQETYIDNCAQKLLDHLHKYYAEA